MLKKGSEGKFLVPDIRLKALSTSLNPSLAGTAVSPKERTISATGQ